MPTTRMQVLGWIEHCETVHPGEGTTIPSWLCTMDAVHEAVADGDVHQIGQCAFIPRMEISTVIYGLTKQGREKFYAGLPVAGEQGNNPMKITVNGTEHRWADASTISYEDIARLAGQPNDKFLSVTYHGRRRGDMKRSGVLFVGKSIACEDGMIFNGLSHVAAGFGGKQAIEKLGHCRRVLR